MSYAHACDMTLGTVTEGHCRFDLNLTARQANTIINAMADEDTRRQQVN